MSDVSQENRPDRQRRDRWHMAGLGLLVFLTRLPWIGAGYGADPDAYRVALAARHIARTGRYAVSRFPGFPVYEYLVALTPAKSSPVLSNGMTALASTVAILLFFMVARSFRIRHPLLPALALAMTPVVYINSTNTMDYLFSLTFLLAGTWLVLEGRPLVAGIFLGLAVGCRLTAVLMVLPLAFWILLHLREDRRKAWRRIVLLVLGTSLTGVLVFLPAILTYGLGFLTFYDTGSYPSVRLLLNRGVWQVWGKPGGWAFLALLMAAPFLLPSVRDSWRRREVREGLALSSTAVLLFTAAFLRLPLETGYLIPAVPFLLLAAALVLPPRIVPALTLAIVLSPFVHVGSHGVSWSGPIFRNHATRQAQVRETHRILERVVRLPGPSVIIAGWWLPRLQLELGGTTQGPHRYVYLLRSPEACRRLLREGRKVFFLRGMADYNRRVKGFDPRKLGARPLP